MKWITIPIVDVRIKKKRYQGFIDIVKGNGRIKAVYCLAIKGFRSHKSKMTFTMRGKKTVSEMSSLFMASVTHLKKSNIIENILRL